MNCENCMLVDVLKTKLEAKQREIDVLSQEVDGIIAICDLIFTAINERLKEHGSAAEPEEGTEKTSNALKQISMIANSVGKPGENTVGDRLAAFLDTVKGLQ